jgi:hypothetical protein
LMQLLRIFCCPYRCCLRVYVRFVCKIRLHKLSPLYSRKAHGWLT